LKFCVRRWLWLLVWLLPFVSYCNACSRAQDRAPKDSAVAAKQPPVQTPSHKELDDVVDRFIGILQSGAPEDFLSLASKEGVSFGIDSDPIPCATLLMQVRQRRGVYCFIFDTDCLRKETIAEWNKAKHSGNIQQIISLREAVRSASSRKINVSPEGSVSWKLNLDGNPAASLINMTTFGFALEQNMWKLTSIEYP